MLKKLLSVFKKKEEPQVKDLAEEIKVSDEAFKVTKEEIEESIKRLDEVVEATKIEPVPFVQVGGYNITPNTEVEQPSNLEWTNDVYIIPVEEKEENPVNHTINAETINIAEALSVNEEEAKEFDVDTDFRFEVYVGMTEDDVKLVNTHDFANVDEARAFGYEYAKSLVDGEGGVVVFIHEEVEQDDGQKVLTRYY